MTVVGQRPEGDAIVPRTTALVRRPVRLFSASRSTRRFRRASDVVVLVPSLCLLLALVLVYPPSRLGHSLAAFLDATPSWLGPVWSIAYDLSALWALGLVVVTVPARRYVVAFHGLVAVGVAVAVAALSARVALGRWPDTGDALLFGAGNDTYPLVRVAVTAAVVLTIGAHLVSPLERAGRWVLVAGVIGASLVEPVLPGSVLAALAAGIVSAAAIRLALGTSAGQPEPKNVIASLAELGVQVGSLEPAARQPAGVFVARGDDSDGQPLLVKVYGRDAYDTHLVQKLWRTAWYQDVGQPLRLSRIEAVEHEALATLLARQAGVRTHEVVTAARSASGDTLLVLRGRHRTFAELAADELDETLLAEAWEAVRRLGATGIAHLHLDPSSLVVVDGVAGVVDFGDATLAPREDQRQTDRAQLLATTAALVGQERAIDAARRALGDDDVAALLPYLQPAAFHSSLRRALDTASVEADGLRAAVADVLGAEQPELVKLRRVTVWSAVQVVLLVLAATTILGALSAVDLDELWSAVESASWVWLAAAFVAAQTPRVTQAISTLGSVPARLPFLPVYAMQLATGYMNLALPSNFARMAVNVRFFQRHGVPPAASITAGAIDSFTSTVVQALLLGVLLIFTSSSLDLGLETPSGDSFQLLVVLACALAVSVAVVVLVPRIRHAVVGRARRFWPEIRNGIVGLRAANKLAQLLGGSIATEVLFATALGMFANAFGYDIGLAQLLLINISVSLLASFVPIPGGIGVAEFGLTVGLTAAGMPEEIALATALVYRIATFYVPPLWGFFAMRWLTRNAHL